MKYPGLGDPAKRKKTLRFLAITAIIAVIAKNRIVFFRFVGSPKPGYFIAKLHYFGIKSFLSL